MLKIINDLIDFVYPPLCSGCKKYLIEQEHFLCLICRANLPFMDHHKRFINNELTDKLYGKVNIKGASALFSHQGEGVVRSVIHELKYKNKPSIGIEVGKIHGVRLISMKQEFDCVVPVPLHRKREKTRGYNQAEKYAIGLSNVLSVQVIPALKRVKNRDTQTKLTRVKRWTNALDVYSLNKKAQQLKGKNVLLVDDVITTGATVESCINILLEAEPASISVACISVAI